MRLRSIFVLLVVVAIVYPIVESIVRPIVEPLLEPHRQRPPNVLLLVSDDQGFGELGRMGHPWIETPELDAMAASGLVLERFYAAAPVCSPTRASLLTGRHPMRTRTFSWGHELPGDEWTIAEALAERGYATGHFGKWHLGSVRAGEPTSPGAQGFEHWASSPNFFDLNPSFSLAGEVRAFEGEGSDVVTDLALDFVRTACAAERPFLAVVWFGNPHLPHAALEADWAQRIAVPEELRAYAAEIAAIDRSVGRLRRELRALGVADDTLVWFTSDNGPRSPGERAAATGGLRGDKGMLWEGGLRVPCVIEWPRVVPAASACAAVTGTVDVLPTLCELAGAPLPSIELDGRSLAGAWREPASFARADGLGFWSPAIEGRVQHAEAILEAQRSGARSPEETPPEVDLAFLSADPLPGPAAWIEGPWKLHARPTATGLEFELYDVGVDAEENDVAGLHPERVARMQSALARWRAEVCRSARR